MYESNLSICNSQINNTRHIHFSSMTQFDPHLGVYLDNFFSTIDFAAVVLIEQCQLKNFHFTSIASAFLQHCCSIPSMSNLELIGDLLISLILKLAQKL